MNCEGYRDKLTDALASGASALDGEAAAHLRACAECKEFYEAQIHLFGAIDSGVRAMVNEAVPASLLAHVWGRVAEAGAPRRMWGVGWRFAAVVSAAVLLIGIGLLKRGPESLSKMSGGPPVVEPGVHDVTSAAPAQPQVSAAGPRRHVILAKAARAPEKSANTPEVIVLAEERAAFARFVTDLPEQRNIAVAFTRPAAETGDEAVKIALLRIDDLDVKPLESSNQ